MADGWETRIITIPSEEAGRIQTTAADIGPLVDEIEAAALDAGDLLGRTEAGQQLRRIATAVLKATEDFRFGSLERLADILMLLGDAIPDAPDDILPDLVVRTRAASLLCGQFVRGLEVGIETDWPLDEFEARILQLAAGEAAPIETTAWHRRSPERVLELDHVVATSRFVPPWSIEVARALAERAAGEAAEADRRRRDRQTSGNEDSQVLVRESTLARLTDIAGQLVLCKNRLFGASRATASSETASPTEEAAAEASTSRAAGPSLPEQIRTIATDFEHLTTDLQGEILYTRTLPISMLFDRYPRVVHDVAAINECEVDLEITGSEVQVDRTVLLELGDILNRMIRFATRSIEGPKVRTDDGKPARGSLHLAAQRRDGAVAISVTGDGRIPSRHEIEALAMTVELADEDELAAMSDLQIMRLLTSDRFPGSDLSGVEGLLKATESRFRLHGDENGFELTLTVPLQATSLRAILCRVGSNDYAVPIRGIVEIVQPDPDELIHASGSILLRRRGQLLPLVPLSGMLEEAEAEPGWTAIVVRTEEETYGMIVDRVLGQEEIVVKRLDTDYAGTGPIAGATIREDGRVSLIVDIDDVAEEAADQVLSPSVAALMAGYVARHAEAEANAALDESRRRAA